MTTWPPQDVPVKPQKPHPGQASVLEALTWVLVAADHDPLRIWGRRHNWMNWTWRRTFWAAVVVWIIGATVNAQYASTPAWLRGLDVVTCVVILVAAPVVLVGWIRRRRGATR